MKSCEQFEREARGRDSARSRPLGLSRAEEWPGQTSPERLGVHSHVGPSSLSHLPHPPAHDLVQWLAQFASDDARSITFLDFDLDPSSRPLCAPAGPPEHFPPVLSTLFTRAINPRTALKTPSPRSPLPRTFARLLRLPSSVLPPSDRVRGDNWCVTSPWWSQNGTSADSCSPIDRSSAAMDLPYSSQSFDHPSLTSAASYSTIPFPADHSQQQYDYAPPPAFLRHNSSSYSNGSGSDSSGDAFRVSQCQNYAYQQPQQQQQYPSHQPQHQQQHYELPQPVSLSTGSAAMLLQQHQANQQAFRSSQAVTAQVFQPASSVNSGNQGDSTAGGSDGVFMREGSESSGSGATQQQGQNGDGDFTQTFYDPFRCVLFPAYLPLPLRFPSIVLLFSSILA